ncbi:NADH-quinone oxidoreductase subunit NuoN [Tropicimonas sediminicola]|uniref:NADH-quinone oxidoreductase subunit N n=1 Tax=Tropicimonas sediminicola TaxID=1031541 RepID=A0A239HIJ2_9RHOB|nr:NADH-quinone oxidoreductase subunit NuoN [Tropicimonas sediminicola]SNS80975.1 NADH dehydrogenase subunit N [Tropicimonas sediminicola]
MTSTDLAIILPEIVLALFAMLALLGAVWTGKDESASTVSWITAAVLVAVAIWISLSGGGTRVAFGGMFVDDAFARFAKVTLLLAAAIVLILSEGFFSRRGALHFEYPVLIVLASVGMMVMVSAGDLIALYMGLELQSLSLYVLAAIRRDSVKSTEAGLKYFTLGALSSGLLLYGASLTYGYAGSTVFKDIFAAATDGHVGIGLLLGLTFMISGFAFKVSAVPFHMWTPDVYEGSPTPVTAFFASAPKMAAMAMFARAMHDAFGDAVADWQQIVALVAVLSIFLGAIAGIGQRDIKRLMAYSSISHMGFALLGLAAGTERGVSAMLIYMAIYVTMNIGTFAFILSMEREGQHVTRIDGVSMLSRKEPLKALAMLVLLFSLAGVPPLVGFFGKFAVLTAALDADLVWVAVLGAVGSVISAFYYLRIVYYMYFGSDEVEQIDGSMSPVQWVVLMVSAAIMVVGVINLFGIDGLAASAAASLVVN